MTKVLSSAPIMRIFKLKPHLSKLEEFSQIGIENLTTSIENETNTLAMYMAHLPEDNTINYVVEVYKDKEAYEKHIASPQFKKFFDFASNGISDRAVFQLVPQLLVEKSQPLYFKNGGDFSIRLAEVEVREEDVRAFKAIVSHEMKESIAKEDGVLAMYAGCETDDLRIWMFFEIYQDEESYENHCLTPHFKDYIDKTSQMLVDKKLTVLTGDCLVNQGGLFFEAKRVN